MTNGGQLRVVTMCTHNRTRSVLMGALLGDHLDALGVDAQIATAGTHGEGQPPTETTVRLLARRGIDVSGHRSTYADADIIAAADLVVTAEVQHVVFVGGRWPDAFTRTFTLPELVQRGEVVGRLGHRSLGTWLTAIGEGRLGGLDYLSDAMVAEVADPTGQSNATWKASFDEIDDLCGRLARLLT